MLNKDFLIIQTTPLKTKEALDRLEVILKEKAVRIFARINHGQAALDVGLNMQPEEVLIFGSPKVGTALMLDCPAIGIELPLKILAWEKEGKTYLAYQNLDKLAENYQLKTSLETIAKLKAFMAALLEAI